MIDVNLNEIQCKKYYLENVTVHFATMVGRLMVGERIDERRLDSLAENYTSYLRFRDRYLEDTKMFCRGYENYKNNRHLIGDKVTEWKDDYESFYRLNNQAELVGCNNRLTFSPFEYATSNNIAYNSSEIEDHSKSILPATIGVIANTLASHEALVKLSDKEISLIQATPRHIIMIAHEVSDLARLRGESDSYAKVKHYSDNVTYLNGAIGNKKAYN